MKEQLLEAKLRMPDIACNGIKRQELLEQIHQMQSRVIILHAGMGYGKTTVMVEYFRTYALSWGWYQLGRRDDDMNRFLYYFEALLQRQVSRFCPHQEVSDWSEEGMELVVQQILEQLEPWEGSLNIVLDDFQYIQNPLIFEFLTLFIHYMGEEIRIFLLLKGRFPGFLTRFVFQGRAGVFEAEDLRIKETEWNRYLQEADNHLPAIEEGEQILEWTEGWPVAVQDALFRKRGKEGSREALREYLEYELFRFLSPEQQVFMAESAALSTLTASVCRSVLKEERAEELLEYFVKQQLLTERRGREGYRYHPVLQDFLKGQVEKQRQEEIRKREADYWLVENDRQPVRSAPAVESQRQSDRKRIVKKNPADNPPFQLICFGGLQIHLGEEKNLIHWRTRKTMEMFAYFWEQEERAVSKDEIMDALWQEEGGQRLESLFHTTLSYLKRAFSEIGIPDLIQMKNKRYTMNKHWFHSDTQRLKQMYGGWKTSMEAVDVEQGVRELLPIYQGDYMEELDGSWVITSREFYQRLYLQCCELLVNHAGSLQRYDMAVRILEQAVKLDPYSDSLNGMLLKYLCAMGEFQIAKQQYERYNRLLKEELNIGIGRQVREIYQNTIARRIS
ncbi:MAG: hypothetical protein NC089_06840 [Bacteroides sp.]|nr:hypothetical protein [Bacteroides sp.]MCM1548435.1 hypothetical protein [Clostridium sp.]